MMAFLKTRPEVALPDIQLLFNAAPMTATPYFFPFKRAYEDGYACRVAVLRPQSRGEVELASADPRVAPKPTAETVPCRQTRRRIGENP